MHPPDTTSPGQGPGGSPYLPRRPLSAAEILDGTLTLYKANFRTFITLGALLGLPALVFSLLVAVLFPFLAQEESPPEVVMALLGLGMLFALFLLVLVTLILRPILTGAVVHATTGLFYGRVPGIRESLRIGWRHGIPLIITTLLVWLIYAIALPVLVLAGLLVLAIITVPAGYVALGVFTYFYPQVITLESRGYFEALLRSFRLVRGHFWRMLGIGVVVVIGTALVRLAVMLPLTVLAAIPTLQNGDPSTFGTVATSVLGAVLEALIAPVPIIAGTLAYLDLRMRKEGLDIWLAAEALAAGRRPS